MTATYDVDGSPVTTVRRGSVNLKQAADHGSPGTGSLLIDDPDGVIATVGQKDFAADQDDCAQPISARGFVTARDISRQGEAAGPSREIAFNFEDLNAMLGFRGFTESDANRPQESIATRAAWLLASAQVVGLFVDNGRCTFSTTIIMDKTDYRLQFPGDVLADMALAQAIASGPINWYIRDFGDGPELVFRNDNTSTEDSSDVRISNIISDVQGDDTGLTFYPNKEFTLTRDPSRVRSKWAETYAKGPPVIKDRPATAAAFNGERFGAASNSNIKTPALAGKVALATLKQLATEEDKLSGTIQVPVSACNLVNQGDRMQARWSHFGPEGYADEFNWFRVLEITRKPLLKPVGKYDLDLVLSPQEAHVTAACPYETTPAGDYYPLGDQPPTGPSEWYAPNVSDGFTYYLSPGIYYPVVPTPGAPGWWHFIAHIGDGGPGSKDFAGDCVSNTLQFMPVGPGTLTVQTEIWDGVRPMAGSWGESPDAYANSIGTFESGDEVEFVVTGNCVNLIRLYDGPGSPCGGKWGWSVAHWEPA